MTHPQVKRNLSRFGLETIAQTDRQMDEQMVKVISIYPDFVCRGYIKMKKTINQKCTRGISLIAMW